MCVFVVCEREKERERERERERESEGEGTVAESGKSYHAIYF